MANINLISARRAERVRLTRTARGLSLACLVAAGLGLTTVGFMGSQVFLAKSAVAGLDKELSKLRPIREQIEMDEDQRLALAPKIETLTQAQAATKRWFGMMEGWKRAIPDRTWLTNVSLEQGAGGRAIKINGITDSQTRVGETMLRLGSQREYYQSVDLRFTTTSQTEGRESVEFELGAPLAENAEGAVSGAGGPNATETN